MTRTHIVTPDFRGDGGPGYCDKDSLLYCDIIYADALGC